MDVGTEPSAAGNAAPAAEAGLRAGEQRFRALVEATAQTVWTTDAAGLVVEDSPSWRAFTGQTREGRAGEGWADAVHPDDRADALARWRAAVAAERPVDTEVRLWHAASGEWRVTRMRAVPVRGTDGAVREWVGMNADVTAQHEAEVARRAAEARYQVVFHAIDQAFHRCEVITDAAGHAVDYRLLEVNPAWTRMTGIAAADAVGRTARELVPDAPEAWIAACGRAGLQRESVRVEQEIPALGMWYDVHLVPFGEPESREFLATAADITARKHAEAERERLAAEVAAERERLRALALSVPAPVALHLGPELRLAIVNPAFRQISGGGRDDTGLPVREAFPELPGQGIIEALERVYATGEPWAASEVPIRYDRRGRGLEDTWFDVRHEPVRDATGAVVGVLNFAVDVTAQVLARREVERLLAESERARGEAEAARDAAEAARVRTERLQALTAALARAGTLEDVATVVVADMVVALGARTGALAGRAPDGDALVLLRTEGFPEPVASGVRRQALDLRSPLIECFRTQAPVWIETREGPAGLDVRYPPIAPVWDALGVGSAAFVPLVAAGETVGVISFAFDGSRRFPAEERAFLLALGQQAALAVERARLFEAEHAARAEAEAANRAKSEFLAVRATSCARRSTRSAATPT